MSDENETENGNLLLKEPIELTYRLERDGSLPTVNLTGVWMRADVMKMAKVVMNEARIHKIKLLNEMKAKEQENARGKQKSKRK